MRILWKNLRYLWRHDLQEDVQIALDDMQNAISPRQTAVLTTADTLQMNIHDFLKTERLPVLTHNARAFMWRNKIDTVEQLTKCTAKQILSESGIGIRTVDYIRYMLDKHGLSLAGEKRPKFNGVYPNDRNHANQPAEPFTVSILRLCQYC